MNTFQKEKLCLNDIEGVVIKELASYWQELSRQNDLGIDGIIFLAKRTHQTGKMIYVQAKYGDSYKYKEDDNSLILNFPTKKLKQWRDYWNSKIEPVILVYQDSKGKIFWVNAKDNSVFTDTTISLSKKLGLNAKSKSQLIKLFGRKNTSGNLDVLKCSKDSRPNYFKRGDLKKNSKELYNEFKNFGFVNFKNEYFNDVKFTRLGWNHITTPKRGTQRITSSLENLGIIKLIFENVSHYYNLKTEQKDSKTLINRIGLKARVVFDSRASGIFQLIVLSRKTFNVEGDYREEKWFLSLHEIK